MYSLYLYFLDLRLVNRSNALEPFKDQQRSNVAVWYWIQRFGSCQIYNKRKKVSAFIIQMKLLFKLVTQIFGYGYVLNQFTDLCLESTFLKKEICLQQRISLDPLLRNMVDIQFILWWNMVFSTNKSVLTSKTQIALSFRKEPDRKDVAIFQGQN